MYKALFMLAIIGMTACSTNSIDYMGDGSNREPATPVRLGGDNSMLHLTDYLPTFGTVDSITGSAGLTLEPIESDWSLFSMRGSIPLGYIDVWQGGKFVRVAVLGERRSAAELLYTTSTTGRAVEIAFSTRPDNVLVLWQNHPLNERFVRVEDDRIVIEIPVGIKTPENSFIRVFCSRGEELYPDVLIPLRKGKAVTDASALDRTDKHAQILYSLMIDRFYNGNLDNDRKLNRPDVLDIVDYQGGDIAGITQKIEEGFFNDLGITTIWISPITQNPWDAWGLYPDPQTRFSGYHGYWPIYTTVIDQRFGTPEELRRMLAAAHEHGLNVILDYVANHLHIDSPVLNDHEDWTTPLILPDGRRNLELWDEQRLTTWFDLHIPTLDLERREIYEPMTDSALYWIENYDFDGFRHDATKHIPEVYWRTLTSKMKERFPQRSLYQIGETYGSAELIGSYVRSGMLDAQFDFNVYDRLIGALADTTTSMSAVADEIARSLNFYGYHNVMGYITGNHDRPRFISLAGGDLSFSEDTKAAGWKREVTVGDAALAYPRLGMLHAVIMTLPGVPCIYQGDEYGVPGGNDPDNRRMMQFGPFEECETKLLETVKTLTHLRRSSMALIYGDYLPLQSGQGFLSFARTYMGETVVTFINNSGTPREIELTLPAGVEQGNFTALFGSAYNAQSASVTVAPNGFEILTNKQL